MKNFVVFCMIVVAAVAFGQKAPAPRSVVAPSSASPAMGEFKELAEKTKQDLEKHGRLLADNQASSRQLSNDMRLLHDELRNPRKKPIQEEELRSIVDGIRNNLKKDLDGLKKDLDGLKGLKFQGAIALLLLLGVLLLGGVVGYFWLNNGIVDNVVYVKERLSKPYDAKESDLNAALKPLLDAALKPLKDALVKIAVQQQQARSDVGLKEDLDGFKDIRSRLSSLVSTCQQTLGSDAAKLSKAVESLMDFPKRLKDSVEDCEKAKHDMIDAQNKLSHVAEEWQHVLNSEPVKILPRMATIVDEVQGTLKDEKTQALEEIGKLKAQLEQIRLGNEQKDGVIKAKTAEMSTLNETVESLKAQIAEKDACVQTHEGNLKSKESSIAKLEASLEAKRNELAQARQDVESLQGNLRDYEEWNRSLVPDWLRSMEALVLSLVKDFLAPSPVCLQIRGVLMDFKAAELSGTCENLESNLARLGHAFYAYLNEKGMEQGAVATDMKKIAEIVNDLPMVRDSSNGVFVKVPRPGFPVDLSYMKCEGGARQVSKVRSWGVLTSSGVHSHAEVM